MAREAVVHHQPKGIYISAGIEWLARHLLRALEPDAAAGVVLRHAAHHAEIREHRGGRIAHHDTRRIEITMELLFAMSHPDRQANLAKDMKYLVVRVFARVH